MGVPVVLAIIVGLACSFIQSLGLTIQRKSHLQDAAKPSDEQLQAVRRPLWIIGFAIYISSNVFGSVFQIGALPIVVLAPLGGVSLLWNSLLAHVLLGEGFSGAMMLGTVLIAGGAVLIAVFGVVPDDNHSLDEILALWARPPFVAFFSIVCACTILTLGAAHIAVWRVTREGRIKISEEDSSPSNYASPQPEPPIPFRVAVRDGRPVPRLHSPVSSINSLPGAVAAKTVRFAPIQEPDDPFVVSKPTADPDERTLTLAGLAFAAASGTLSGLCLVLAKAAVELVISTIAYWGTGHGQNEFARVQTWFLVAGLGAAAVLQLVYLNYGLLFASPALICPLAFCFFNLASIFDGLVFYDQIGRLEIHQLVLVTLGVATLLVGVWSVSAIQPTGQGGVEMGTWVEEDALCDEPSEIDIEAHDELEAGEGATLLGRGPISEEPISIDTSPPATRTVPHSAPASPMPPGVSADSGDSIMSPHAPESPSFRKTVRRPRFGTLIPEFAPAGAPTGFAFGIGAASPGFALRHNSISQHTGSVSGSLPYPRKRVRSRSEVDVGAAAQVLGRRRVVSGGSYSIDGIAPDDISSNGIGTRPFVPKHKPLDRSFTIPPTATGAALGVTLPSTSPTAEHVESTIASWGREQPTADAEQPTRQWWWPRWWRKDDGVKLP